MKRRTVIGPAMLFAVVLAAGDAAVVWYFEQVREGDRETQAAQVKGQVTAAILRHVEAVTVLAKPSPGGSEAERARSIAELFPALAGVARFGPGGAPAFSADLRGESEAGQLVAATPAAKAALGGTPAIGEPWMTKKHEMVVAIWVPAPAGAVAGVFRLDRMIGDAVNASAGEDSPYVLTDSRGGKPTERDPVAEAALRIPLTLPGPTWTLNVRESREDLTKTQALIASIVALSVVLWLGFVATRRRILVDSRRLEERAAELDRMAKDVEELAGNERRERGKLFTILDSLEESVVMAGPQGETLMCNRAGEKLLGPEPKLVRPDGTDVAPEELPLALAIARKEPVSTEELCAKREGALIAVSVVAAPLYDQDRANVIGAVAVFRDISKLREWEDTVRNRDFALTVKNKFAAEVQEAKNEDEVLKRLNYHLELVIQPQSTNVFLRRQGSDRLRAERTSGLKSVPGVEPPVIANPSICQVLETGEPMDPRTCAERVQPCLGRIATCGFLCAPLRVGGKVEGTVHLELGQENVEPHRLDLALDLIAAASTAIQAKRFIALIAQAAIRDPLTSLYNRRYFDETARVMVAQSKRNHHALGALMIDIDHFKVFNDTYGHDAGDVVLKEFARALLGTARQSDVMVRYGGEEFAVLLPETNLNQARIAADRILEAARRIRLPLPGLEDARVAVSIGVSAFPEHGDTPESLVKAADTALYAAKAAGRNCARVQGDSKIPAVAGTPPPAAAAP